MPIHCGMTVKLAKDAYISTQYRCVVCVKVKITTNDLS